MKKYDELLKKVEMFEKLAVYGSRGEFLKSIAQVTPSEESLRFMSPDQRAHFIQEFNKKQLDEEAKREGRLALEGAPTLRDVPKYQQDWAMGLPPSEIPFVPPKAPASPAAAKSPVTAPTTHTAPRPTYQVSPEVTAIQTMLDKEGYLVGKIDGKLGPQTKAALREKYPGKTDAEALRLALVNITHNRDLGF